MMNVERPKEENDERVWTDEQLEVFVACIRKLLRQRGVSILVLSKNLNIPLRYLSDCLFGRRRIPEWIAKDLLELLKVDFDGRTVIEYSFSKTHGGTTQEKDFVFTDRTSFYWNTDETEEVGKRIVGIRRLRGLSREAFGRSLEPKGIPVEVIKIWERGIKLPSLYYCYKLSKVYEISLEWLLTGI
jgi:Predicted transcriptional regulator